MAILTSQLFLAPPAQHQQAGPALGGAFGNASLYVGDLDGSVVEGDLYDLFSQIGTVVSIRVCRDVVRRVSLGYAYVNYSTAQEASLAIEVLNFTSINGKPIRIMFSQRDPSIRKSGFGNIFIKNLDSNIDNKSLYQLFASFGKVLSCKVAMDNNSQSKGYGYVQFEHEESAQKAIQEFNGMLFNGRKVYVDFFVRRQERNQENGFLKFTNVYVKNLSESTSDEDLKNIFGEYGPITSAVVMKDAKGNSRCFGFVNFQNPNDAATAVDKLNGYTLNDDKEWYVGRALRKSERESELKAKYEQERNVRWEKLKEANLYLKNLDDTIDEEKLKDLFSVFGTLTSCKVMVDSQGCSKCFGFVAFSSPEEASRAIIEMNGKMVGKKPLYVAVAQRKEERRARLQAHFSQLRSSGTMPTGLELSIPGYSSAPRFVSQQIYLGQGAPGIIPHQPAGYGFQQQLIPGIHPGIASNYLMPYHLQRQGQTRQRMGIRRGGSSQQMQQQQCNANRGFRYIPNAQNGFDPSLVPQGTASPMVPLSSDAIVLPPAPVEARHWPIPISTLASTLCSASPENQRIMLGEQLFPLVERIERDYAGKVTGMLLEMDQTEVLHLIESPDALKKKIDEAMAVLQVARASSPDVAATNLLGFSPLND